MGPVKLRLLGAALLALVAASVLLADPDPIADLRSYEDVGMAGLADTVEERRGEPSTLFASQASLRNPGDVGVVLVPGTPEPLTPGEVNALEGHLQRDTDLWLLEETTNTRAILDPHGVRVIPDRVLQPDSTYGEAEPGLVEATVHVDGEPYAVLLSSPVLLDVNESRADPIGHTEVAFRDVNRSGDVDAGDPAGEHPIAARGGNASSLLVVSDAGVFTNGVLEADGFENRQLLEALVGQAPDGRVVVDATRNDPAAWMAPAKVSMDALLRVGTSPVPAGLALLALAGFGLVIVRQAPKREAWRMHEHRVGEPMPAPEDAQATRLASLLALELGDERDEDAQTLAARPLDELCELARRELDLTVPPDPEAREQAFTALRSNMKKSREAHHQ